LGHSKGTSCRTPLAKILHPPLGPGPGPAGRLVGAIASTCGGLWTHGISTVSLMECGMSSLFVSFRRKMFARWLRSIRNLLIRAACRASACLSRPTAADGFVDERQVAASSCCARCGLTPAADMGRKAAALDRTDRQTDT